MFTLWKCSGESKMIWDFLGKIFGNRNDREIKKFLPYVDKINSLAGEFKDKSDQELKDFSDELKNRFKNVEDVDQKMEEVLPEAFALVREVAERTIGLRPFDVQLIGGMVLHRGMISEMKTGEGKTLAATMPAYLNVIAGYKVHIVTVNDYLARRDADWMSPIYEFLGLEVGILQNMMEYDERHRAYRCNIIYGTNSEFGFDYLRDNMVTSIEHTVQTGLDFCIIDEVDSILIDEARTPLIISGPSVESTKKYGTLNKFVKRLKTSSLLNQYYNEMKKNIISKNEDELNELCNRINFPKIKITEALYQDQETMDEFFNRILTRLIDDKKNIVTRIMEELDKIIGSNDLASVRSILEKYMINISISDDIFRDTKKFKHHVKTMIEGDFDVDEKSKNVSINESGIEKMEEWLGIENLYAPETFHLVHYIEQLLKAHYCFKRDVDYLIRDQQVMIVDEFTGRVLEGRRFSDGLHQALEAKEDVPVKEENQTLATITIQNYFRMYKKLSGMTGTALTEGTEFMQIYKLDVLVMPTNEPMIRRDYNDVIYKTKKAKFNAVVEEISKFHKMGRPILVGTTSIQSSEYLANLLRTKKQIQVNVLNARHHQREAEIIKRAGQKGGITIATNMAGRGTDIKLGEGIVKCPRIDGEMYCWAKPPKPDCKECAEEKINCKKEVECGLYIIGTERHESRRIDNQLRGRSGRQGDPGSSKFLVSLEDDLLHLFGSDRMKNMLDRLGFEEGDQIEHPLLSKGIERAQKQVEERNFEIRKELLKYDDVNNGQRKSIYSLRGKILAMDGIEYEVLDMLKSSVVGNIEKYFPAKALPDEWKLNDAKDYLEDLNIEGITVLNSDPTELVPENLYKEIETKIDVMFDNRKKELGEDFPFFLKSISLQPLDFHWRDHLYSMDQLRDVISYRAYGQKDPLIEYKKESFDLFQNMWIEIEDDIAEMFFKLSEKVSIEEFIHIKKVEEFYQGHQQDASLLMKNESSKDSIVKEKRENITRNKGFGKRRKKK